MKKLCVVLLALLMVFSLVACDKGGAPDPGKKDPEKVTEVFLFSSIGAYKALLEREIPKYNEGEGKEKGVVLVMETNIDNYGTALQAMIEGGNYPDMADMYARPDHLAAGYARDLGKIDELKDLVERFKPYLAQGVNYQGEALYALPLEILPLKMVYNNVIFEKCGITEPPKTWDEMADMAKLITEKGKSEANPFYGFGWTTMWTASFTRLLMEATVGSTGISYFNNNTGAYDFTPWEAGVKAIARMYQEGSMFPTPLDQHIDPIRNRFAEGLVGMEIAPAYDVSVYTTQFVADFDWRVADVPALTDAGKQYNSASLNRANVSLTKWIDEERMPAAIEAFKFMHSKELYKTIYSNSGMIPHEPELIAEVKKAGFESMAVNWDVMSDTAGYTLINVHPTSLLTLTGDGVHAVFTNIMLGETTWEKEIEGLNKRYNDAYQAAKKDGLIDVAIYEAGYDPGKLSK